MNETLLLQLRYQLLAADSSLQVQIPSFFSSLFHNLGVTKYMSNIFCLQTQQNKARQLEEQLKKTESSLQVKAVKEPLRVVV